MTVGYIYDTEISNFHLGTKHPLKPHRVRFTHSLVHSYGLDKYLDVVEPELVTSTLYHQERYMRGYVGVDSDCPSFPGIDEYVTRLVSGTLNAARMLISGDYNIVINWGGGMHHAGKATPKGFCYANDIVVAILEMLRYYRKVMYIDIDVHHGDGVEEAFYFTDRVLTLSLHKYGDGYFPETGALCNIGAGSGYRYAYNAPMKTGITDEMYEVIFHPVVKHCVKKFKPEAIVMQCGADSLAGDRIGCFNLSISGHSGLIRFVKELGLPMLVLGGGGYTPRNVSRCWAYATSVLCERSIPVEIPESDLFYKHYPSGNILDCKGLSKYKNFNTTDLVENISRFILENLDKI